MFAIIGKGQVISENNLKEMLDSMGVNDSSSIIKEIVRRGKAIINNNMRVMYVR